MTDEQLDARFRALGPVEPPPAAVAAVLAGVEADRAAARRRRWGWTGAAMALAAGLVVAVLPSATEAPADPARLVPKGVGAPVSGLELAVAVRRGDAVERLLPGAPVAPGDTLLFRVRSAVPTTVRLYREDAELWSGRVEAGEHDLPVGWTVEPGEGPAMYRVVGAGAHAVVTVGGGR